MNAQTIPNGTYTLVNPKTGGYRTLRVESAGEGWDNLTAGTRIMSFLSGPDNTTDFTRFAFINPTGQANVWGRFRGRADLVAAAKFLTTRGVGRFLELGRAYAEKSGKCMFCNRVLTVPGSMHYGYGPDCAERRGLPYSRSAGVGPRTPVENEDLEMQAMEAAADRAGTARDNLEKEIARQAMEKGVASVGWQAVRGGRTYEQLFPNG